MTKQITCKTGLKKNVISKKVFDREISPCRMLSKKGKCGWGKCKNCGVVPLLVKLHHGKLIDDPVGIQKVKDKNLE